MRWFHLAVVAVFALVMLIFVIQNLESTTLTFLGFSMTVPLALAFVIAYVLGMATGGSLWSLLRKSVEGSTGRTAGS
jgi:uncharacterized integral membrane protein